MTHLVHLGLWCGQQEFEFTDAKGAKIDDLGPHGFAFGRAGGGDSD